jgi:hypothetical protein
VENILQGSLTFLMPICLLQRSEVSGPSKAVQGTYRCAFTTPWRIRLPVLLRRNLTPAISATLGVDLMEPVSSAEGDG